MRIIDSSNKWCTNTTNLTNDFKCINVHLKHRYMKAFIKNPVIGRVIAHKPVDFYWKHLQKGY